MTQGLDTFDIHAPDARENAECVWALMRETKGLYRNEGYGGYYVASRFEDVMTVLMKPEIFGSSKGLTLPPPTAIRSYHIPAELDPPEHREYRALIAPLLTPAHARAIEPAIGERVGQLMNALPVGESFDFVRAFARPLPIMVALDILGLPQDDAAAIETMVDDLHHQIATGENKGAGKRLDEYVYSLIDARRPTVSDPEADIMSSILLGEAFGRALERHEQMSMIRLLMVGGFDTTSIAVATMMWWLATNPDQAERLRANPEGFDKASEEIVRFSSPSTYLRRELMQDFELAGTALKKGDSVLVAFGAANLDEAKFQCPMTIDPERKPNQHVGFGAGRHRCVGSFVAKAQMRVAFTMLLERFDGFRLDESQPIEYYSGLGQGIMKLPLIMAAR